MLQLIALSNAMEVTSYNNVVQALITDIVDIRNGKEAIRTAKPEEGSRVPFWNIGGIDGYTQKSICDKPCIAIGVAGTVGKPKLLFPPYWVGGTQIYLVPKNEKINIYWLFSHINYINWKYFTNPYAIPPKLSMEEFKELYLEVPDYELIDKIGKLYKNILRERELSREAIENIEKLKQMIFHIMFGDPTAALAKDDAFSNPENYYKLT